MNKEHLLVIRLSALGDVAMTIPVVYSLATNYPTLKITVLTLPFFTQLFINCPSNIHVKAYDKKGIHKGLMGKIKLFTELKNLHFTAIADLHNVLRSWQIDVFMLLLGKRLRMLNKARAMRKQLINCPETQNRISQKPYIHRYCDVFAALGYPVKLSFQSIFNNQPIQPPIKIPHNSIGIAPFARYNTKTCPLQTMQTLVKSLVKEGYFIVLYGGRGDEQTILDSWANTINNCISLAGKLSLPEELATMSQLKCMISMDSANMHLASLVATRVLSIWGSTTPHCGFMGYNQQTADAISLNLPCQPCNIAGANTCKKGTLACLNGLNNTLFTAVQQRINA